METISENEIGLAILCYACLSGKDLKKMETKNSDFEHFSNMYKACTSLDLMEIAVLPLFFCDTCIETVEDFYKFREACWQSHATIEAALKRREEVFFCEEDANNVASINVDLGLEKEDSRQISTSPIDNNESQLNEQNAVDLTDADKLQFKEVDTRSFLPKGVFKCIICSEHFEDIKSLGNHNEIVHFTKDYKCGACEETFNNSWSLRDHIKIHKDLTKFDKPYACARCDKSYTAVPNLQIHIFDHLGINPYKCRLCPKEFKRAFTLQAHLDLHRGIRKFLCSDCGKECSTSQHLRRHQNLHLPDGKPYKCKMCPVSCTSAGELTIHVRTHTGEKRHLCPFCGKSFIRAHHFTIHKRSHTGERPYKCSFCEKGFTQSCDLKTHERLHKGIKPFICDICNKRFNQSSSLNNHLITHKRLECGVCHQSFTQVYNLKKHLEMHLKEEGLVTSNKNTNNFLQL